MNWIEKGTNLLIGMLIAVGVMLMAYVIVLIAEGIWKVIT